MTWILNETVTAGNSQARVKNYYPESGLLVLYDISGTIEVGSTIVGQTSGTSLTLSSFVISDAYDLGYEPDSWADVLDIAIYDGNGNLVVLDQYFSNPNSTDYFVVNG